VQRVLAVGAGLAVLLPALAVVAMVGGLASLADGGCPGAATLVASGPVSESDVPSAPPPPYVGAVGNYGLGPDGWSNLATINYVEPDFGQDLSTSQAGAIGVDAVQAVDLGDIPGDPVRRDGPNDPSGGERSRRRDLHDGKLPAGSTARPGDWNGAIFAYNHAAWYVSEVDSDAAHYQSATGGQATVDVSAIITSSGGNAGTTGAGQPNERGDGTRRGGTEGSRARTAAAAVDRGRRPLEEPPHPGRAVPER